MAAYHQVYDYVTCRLTALTEISCYTCINYRIHLPFTMAFNSAITDCKKSLLHRMSNKLTSKVFNVESTVKNWLPSDAVKFSVDR